MIELMATGTENPMYGHGDGNTTDADPAKPAGLPAQMVTTNVPGYMPGFETPNFDPESQNVLNQTYITHQSHERLKREIDSQTGMLQQMAREQFSSLQDHMNYETLLNGLLFRGEGVLNNYQYLYYTNVQFLDETGTTTIGVPMSNGRALLTDRRLLLMTAEVAESSKLEKFGDPKKTPGGYHITVNHADSTCYKPIPLHNFYSIELYTAAGVRSEQNINAQAPCCCGMFGCCFGCTGVESCTKTWHLDMPLSHSHNERMIILGTTLPPWGKRCMIRIHIHPNVPLTVAKDFVSALQCFAIHLH